MVVASDVHIDAALSNMAVSYKNGNYIAEDVFPSVPVTKQSDKYYKWTKDYWFRSYVQERSPGTDYPEADIELTTDEYFAKIYNLATAIPWEDMSNQDAAVQLEQTKTEWLADQFMLHREQNLEDAIFKSLVWTTDHALSGTTQWSNAASNPVIDIYTGKETIEKLTGKTPNVLIIGAEVVKHLKEHPDLLDKYKYTTRGILDLSQVAAALEIPKIVVGRAIENTADEGAAFSGGYIWGKNALLMYSEPSPGIRTASAGYCFKWNIENGSFPVQIQRVEDKMKDRDVFKGKHSYVNKIVAADLGYFISGAVA